MAAMAFSALTRNIDTWLVRVRDRVRVRVRVGVRGVRDGLGGVGAIGVAEAGVDHVHLEHG